VTARQAAVASASVELTVGCVNTTSGIALSWTPLAAPIGRVTYTVWQCDRAAEPRQPGCTALLTTNAPELVGPVSLGSDYLVDAVDGSGLVVSNRLSL
jgi:hypothetical protein